MLFAEESSNNIWCVLLFLWFIGLGVKKLSSSISSLDKEGHVKTAAKASAIRFFTNLFIKK